MFCFFFFFNIPDLYQMALSRVLISGIHVREPAGDVLIFMTGQDDIEKMVAKLEERIQTLEEGSCMDAMVLPLHGSLPPELQVCLTSDFVVMFFTVILYTLLFVPGSCFHSSTSQLSSFYRCYKHCWDFFNCRWCSVRHSMLFDLF